MTANNQPRFGVQGAVVAWQDPWGKEASEHIHRTGEGQIYPSQDPRPTPQAFIDQLVGSGADFYLHHVFPGAEDDAAGLFRDVSRAGLGLVLGNEYGNANGPWIEGTNRYDLPDDRLTKAAVETELIGLMYDEPEHLQTNANIYRREHWLPHFCDTEGLSLEAARNSVEDVVRSRAQRIRQIVARTGKPDAPMVTEHVFPIYYHLFARAGAAVCPKVMKESFQPIQLATALGAARQYQVPMWICADLWGIDIGPWFTRTWGLPAHPVEEYDSALKMAYWMGPTHLFTENADALWQNTEKGFRNSPHGEVWEAFIKGYVPNHPLPWSHRDVNSRIIIVRSEDGNFGQNMRLFGQQQGEVSPRTNSSSPIWHLLSHGQLTELGQCMHIGGFDMPATHEPRSKENYKKFPLVNGFDVQPDKMAHPLFAAMPDVMVYDEFAAADALYAHAELIFLAGERVTEGALKAVRRAAERGATVVAAEWLLPAEWRQSGRVGEGQWLVTADFLSDEAREAVAPHLGREDEWTQRFADRELIIKAKDAYGFSLDFEIR